MTDFMQQVICVNALYDLFKATPFYVILHHSTILAMIRDGNTL